jgi:hypothetical protein
VDMRAGVALNAVLSRQTRRIILSSCDAIQRHPKQKRQPIGCLFAKTENTRGELLARAGARVALLELVDTTSRVDDFVLARVERVRLRRDFDADQRIFFTVCPLHFFFAFDIGSRLGQEFEIARRIKKDHFVVRWMNVGFHVNLPFFP